MKKFVLISAFASLSACSTHQLASTQISDLDDVRAAIQQAKDANAEHCAPKLQAQAVTTMYQAAHEITDEAGYHPDEDAELIQYALSSAKQAKEAAVKNCAKPKPIMVKHKTTQVHIAVKAPIVKKVNKPVVLEVIHLEGIYFEVNSANLTSESTASLTKAVTVLKKRPDIRVEVAAYTDSRGKSLYNLELSKKRAKSVMGYLLAHGIDAARVSSQGYGEANPVADNATREGRAKNRRVEFHVLK